MNLITVYTFVALMGGSWELPNPIHFKTEAECLAFEKQWDEGDLGDYIRDEKTFCVKNYILPKQPLIDLSENGSEESYGY